MPGRGDPGGDDRRGGGQAGRCPRRGSRRSHSRRSGRGCSRWRGCGRPGSRRCGRDVGEVVLGDQFLAVAFGGLFEIRAAVRAALSPFSARSRLIRHRTAARTSATFSAVGRQFGVLAGRGEDGGDHSPRVSGAPVCPAVVTERGAGGAGAVTRRAADLGVFVRRGLPACMREWRLRRRSDRRRDAPCAGGVVAARRSWPAVVARVLTVARRGGRRAWRRAAGAASEERAAEDRQARLLEGFGAARHPQRCRPARSVYLRLAAESGRVGERRQ